MKKLKCHCGEVEAEINVPDNLEKVLKCNCSICKRKGAIMSMVKNEDFKIIKGEDKLTLYQFHSKIAKHYFCSSVKLRLIFFDIIYSITLKGLPSTQASRSSII